MVNHTATEIFLGQKSYTYEVFAPTKKHMTGCCAAYVISKVERVVGAVGEDLVELVKLGEHLLGLRAEALALHAAVLDLLQLQEVSRDVEQFLQN